MILEIVKGGRYHSPLIEGVIHIIHIYCVGDRAVFLYETPSDRGAHINKFLCEEFNIPLAYIEYKYFMKGSPLFESLVPVRIVLK